MIYPYSIILYTEVTNSKLVEGSQLVYMNKAGRLKKNKTKIPGDKPVPSLN